MPTLSEEYLSASAGGQNIKVAATTSPGTTIHTVPASVKDEVYLEAANNDTVDRDLIVQLGGTTSPDDQFTITLPAKVGMVPIVSGRVFAATKVIRAYCATTNVIVIGGQVIRSTP